MSLTAVSNQSRKVAFLDIRSKKIFVVEDTVFHSKKLVIMSHGFRGTSTGPARQFVDFSVLLNQHGISTLRFDQPCSGNSVGDYLESSFSEWVETTVSLAQEYIQQGYQVALLGQSMGATTCVAASADKTLQGKIVALLLWVPDPKSSTQVESDMVFEEGGQKYTGRFWNEARESDFFGCLDKYSNPIHLVYGENDRYISATLRDKVISRVREKEGKVCILSGEDHSPWQYENAQRVMSEEMKFLQNVFT